jgi:hypothetical protein
MREGDVWRFKGPDPGGLEVTVQFVYDRHFVLGQSAVLPALIDCPKCPRRNRVPVPQERVPDSVEPWNAYPDEWYEHPIAGPVSHPWERGQRAIAREKFERDWQLAVLQRLADARRQCDSVGRSWSQMSSEERRAIIDAALADVRRQYFESDDGHL